MLSSQLVEKIFKDNGIDAYKYEAAFNELEKTDRFLDELDSALSECSAAQEILNVSSERTQCPFFYFNRDYSINAMTTNLEFEPDEEWEYMASKGYLSPLTARLMKEGGDLSFLADSDDPVFLNNPMLFPFPSVNGNVRFHGEFAGRLTMIGPLRDLNESDTEVVKIMIRHLVRLLEQEQTDPGGGALKKMFRNILSGGSYSDGHIKNIMIEAGFPVSCIYALYAADTNSEGDPQVPVYYESALERVMTGEKVLIFTYGDSLILLACAKTEGGFSTVEFKLNAFLNAQDLKAGAGNYFKDMTDFSGAYSQALSALRAGSGAFTRFKDIMLENMLSYIPDDDIRYVISDDIFRLLDADEECSFSMTATLKSYLENGCSLQRAADSLYIHKNTMLYRLGKIKEVIFADLDDPEECLKLSLSVKLYERLKL